MFCFTFPCEQARQEAISAKRKLMINNLFEKWDNDGSGYLDQDEVESVMLLYKDGQEAEAIHIGKLIVTR